MSAQHFTQVLALLRRIALQLPADPHAKMVEAAF